MNELKLKKCPNCNIDHPVDSEGLHIPHKQFLSAVWCITPTAYYGMNPIRQFPMQIIDQLETERIASVEERCNTADTEKYTAEIKREMDALRFYWNFMVDQYYRE